MLGIEKAADHISVSWEITRELRLPDEPILLDHVYCNNRGHRFGISGLQEVARLMANIMDGRCTCPEFWRGLPKNKRPICVVHGK